MSDRQFLIARELPRAEREGLAAPPPSPHGFVRRQDDAALHVLLGDEIVWAAAFYRAELRALGRSIARAAVFGQPTTPRAETDPNRDLLDRCYRSVIDFASAGSCAAHVIVLELGDSQQRHVDVLWRLALALDGRITIREMQNRIRVELYPPGRGGDLAALVTARPYVAIRAAATHAAALLKLGRQRPDTLAIVARDLSAFEMTVTPSVPVQFSEVPREEVRLHPRRFGLPLSAVDALQDRHQFVGQMHGEIVFRVALHMSPPVLDLLPSGLISKLPRPIALLTEAYTEPAFRNRSIFTAGLRWSAEWARRQGVGTLMMLIRVDNEPSLRAAVKERFERLGELALPPE